MNCYRVINGQVTSGIPIVRPENGLPFVLVGHAVTASSFLTQARQYDGVKIFLTDKLAATLKSDCTDVMDAGFIRQEDGTYRLGAAIDDGGVLVFYAVGKSQEEYAVDVPLSSDRTIIQYTAVVGGHYSGRTNHPFILTSLRPNESISVGIRKKVLRSGTGRSLRHPFRAPLYDSCVEPKESLRFHGGKLIFNRNVDQIAA